MSWLRTSPLRQSLSRSSINSSTTAGSSQEAAASNSAVRPRSVDTATDCDPRACYDSFCKHWQQAYDMIQRFDPVSQKNPAHDDVLGVVSHLDFMVTLLLVELQHCNKIIVSSTNDSEAAPPAPCLEFMLSENLLDKLYEWGIKTGRYANAVRLEQLKLYELLVSHSRHQLLCHEPFLRPLLKILASSQGEMFPPDLEKRLVILLNQLCVVLMQNVHLLDLFFFSAEQEQNKLQSVGDTNGEQQQKEVSNSTNFIIFSLLVPYVHREGSLGHQARDALLLCMALSQKNSNVGTYIAQYSSMSPLLVTGLGGLYSRLPTSLEISSPEWHSITPDDVTDIPELTLFMNALEFCNAVVQVAHDSIKNQLLDFMYQGFIIPVLGPSILQTLKGKHFQTNIDSQISAMSYLELILRSVTEPDLLRAFVKFLLDTDKFDGERILDTLIERLRSNNAHLCMVTLTFFNTLLGLHSEDIMVELLLKYLISSKHVPTSYRHKINKSEPYTMAEFFLQLTPDVMRRACELTKHKYVGETINSSHNQSAQTAHISPLPSPTSSMSKTIGANWNYYGVHTGESMYSNYNAYLLEARYKIEECRQACAKWNYNYTYQKSLHNPTSTAAANTAELIKQFLEEFGDIALETNIPSTISRVIASTTPAVTATTAPTVTAMTAPTATATTIATATTTPTVTTPTTPALITPTPTVTAMTTATVTATTTAPVEGAVANLDASRTSCSEKNKCDSLQSIGESSGYESLKWRPVDEDGAVALVPNVAALSLEEEVAECNRNTEDFWRLHSVAHDSTYPRDLDFSEDLFEEGTVNLGPFLNAVWAKLQTFTSNSLYVNLHLTGLITHLSWYPIPLIHSVILRLDVIITSDIPSFFQILSMLKQQIDAELPVTEDSLELIDVARSFLIDRELRYINARKSEATKLMHNPRATQPQSGLQSTSSSVQVTPSSSYDPFKRNETKRKSLGKSLTSIFSRKTNGSALTNNGSNNSLATSVSAHSRTREGSLTHETSLSTISDRSERLATDQSFVSDSTLSLETGGEAASSTSMLSTLTTGGTTLASIGGGNSEPVSLDSASSIHGAIANTSGTERTRELALCAVLLDEWLKELAAVAEEQNLDLIISNI